MRLRIDYAFVLLFSLAGCAGAPCDTTDQCASGESCDSGHCAALQSGALVFAIEPSTGMCRPLVVGVSDGPAHAWKTCDNPCHGLGEYGCIGDPRCQPVYSAPQTGGVGNIPACVPGPNEGDTGCGFPSVTLTFLGCRANPLPPGPQGCAAHGGDGNACAADPLCVATGDGCVARGCSGLDEKGCLSDGACHAIGTDCYCPPYADCACDGGHFLGCNDDDQLVRCTSDDQCGSDQRCNVDEGCLPPVSGTVPPSCPGDTPCAFGAAVDACVGACVPKGCTGYGEKFCLADPSCEATYTLECQPYCGGGGDFQPGPGPGCGCQPTFAGCEDGPHDPIITDGKSLLIRDPKIIDAPDYAFGNVMAKIAGADPAPLVNAWLNQMTTTVTVGDKVAQPRVGASGFLASLPRRSDGLFDPAALGLRPTSLSNRLDLATASDCGEARITYAHAEPDGTVNAKNRMTVIVELRQDDDGQGCRTVAQRWTALSKLDGDALAQAVRAIYAPLIDRAHVHQIRTNEFLRADLQAEAVAWELREWRFGDDGQLHLAPSKQAIDPNAVSQPEFQSWVAQNQPQLIAGTAIVPDAFLAVTSSEDGTRVKIDGGPLDQAVNGMACAGCHLTETQSAFVHVGERFGDARAPLSSFLLGELAKRAANLEHVARGDQLMARPIALTRPH